MVEFPALGSVEVNLGEEHLAEFLVEFLDEGLVGG